MSTHQDIFGLIDPGSKVVRPPLVWMQSFHQGAVRLADFGVRCPWTKAKHLKGLILGHAALPRATDLPRVRIALSVFSPDGKPAAQIRV